MNRFVTDFSTAKSSYLTGAGSVFNLAGSYYRFKISPNPRVTDAKALFSDFAMIGQDLKAAMAAQSSGDQKQLTFPFATS